MMTAIDDGWDRVYATTQAYNYKKREETLITNTTREEALKNAHQLIESEEMAKSKAERKEAKKKRQKEKKKAEKSNNCTDDKTISSNSVASLDRDSTTEINETKTVDETEANDFEFFYQGEINDDEILDVNAAFVKVSVKHNRNTASNKTLAPSKPEKVTQSSYPMYIPPPKFIKPKMTKSQLEKAEMLGMQSYALALNGNDFDKAIEFLSQAIFLAPEDARHLLNRSYCYLRIGQYDTALSDAQSAKNHSQLPEHFAKAVAREGQALCGLQKYHEAEKCFEEILKLGEGNAWIFTELILARAFQLTNMGFSMKDALKALQQCSAVVDAVTLLTSGNISSLELETSINKSEIESCNGEDIYSSDDESSSTILVSKLVSAITDESCYLEGLQFQPSSSKTRHYSTSSERTLKSSSSMESLPRNNGIKSNSNIKSLPSTSKTENQKAIQSSIANQTSTIWVGSIDKSITDSKLKKVFGIFGSINYIKRFADERNYVFIDFACKKSANLALAHKSGFEINGIKLPVKPSFGNFGRK